MLISTSVFLIFFEIFIFGADSAKNGPKLQKILSHSVSQELYLILFWFLVHICKMMIFPSIFVSCFQISDFSGFSELINKCQKEILRCAPTSSHVCDFFSSKKLFLSFSGRFACSVLGGKIQGREGHDASAFHGVWYECPN